MTSLHVLVLVANDAEVVERLDSEYSKTGLVAALAAAAQRDVILTIATTEPLTHVDKPYAQHAIIHSLRSEKAPITDRLLAKLGAVRIRAALTTTPLGRLINSLSATDPSRIFARAYRHNPVVSADEFDLVIALDIASIRTAWLLNRRHRATSATFGEAAAIAHLSETR